MTVWCEQSKRDFAIYSGIGSVVVGLSFLVLFVANEETRYWLTKEDGLFESFGAIGWLIASIVFLVVWWKERCGNDLIVLRTTRNCGFLLLAIFCFMACGEEISWGQRIFGLETPEVLTKINQQNEINLHNIYFFQGRNTTGEAKSFWAGMLGMTRLFQYFLIVYCVLLPLVGRYSRFAMSWIRRVNIPMVPVGLGAVFVANYLVTRIIPFFWSQSIKTGTHFLVETKEFNYGILFMLLGFYFLWSTGKDGRETTPIPTNIGTQEGIEDLCTEHWPK